MHYCFRKIKRRISLLTASFSFLFSKLNKDNQPNAPQPALSPKPTKKVSATKMTVACLPQHSCQSPSYITKHLKTYTAFFTFFSAAATEIFITSDKEETELVPSSPSLLLLFHNHSRRGGTFFFFSLNPLLS